MKSLLCGLIAWLFLCGQAFGGWFTETIYVQELAFAELVNGVNTYSTDLGEVRIDGGGLILWWTIQSSDAVPSTDYDVYFFSEDNATWTDMVDTEEQIYKKTGITTAYYNDDTIFPFVSTGTTPTGKLYVGIKNDDGANASPFQMKIYFERRNQEQLTTSTDIGGS